MSSSIGRASASARLTASSAGTLFTRPRGRWFSRGRCSNGCPCDAAQVTDEQSTYRDGIRTGLPFAVAAGLAGVSFGIIAEPVMGATAAIVMSVFVFAGAAQFGATAVLASGGSAVTAILAGLMLNARYLPMGVAIAGSLKGGPLRRAVEGQAVVDASWAASHLGGGRF